MLMCWRLWSWCVKANVKIILLSDLAVLFIEHTLSVDGIDVSNESVVRVLMFPKGCRAMSSQTRGVNNGMECFNLPLFGPFVTASRSQWKRQKRVLGTTSLESKRET